jgi:hypothetical protein
MLKRAKAGTPAPPPSPLKLSHKKPFQIFTQFDSNPTLANRFQIKKIWRDMANKFRGIYTQTYCVLYIHFQILLQFICVLLNWLHNSVHAGISDTVHHYLSTF